MSKSSVADEIAAERARQMSEEGWTTSHDDAHYNGEIAEAAIVYAAPYQNRDYLWPWDTSPKHKDRRRDLIRAGALIVAEIERLDRLQQERAGSAGDNADG